MMNSFINIDDDIDDDFISENWDTQAQKNEKRP